jgi:hypothetical protein
MRPDVRTGASTGACTSADLDTAGFSLHEPQQFVLANDRPEASISAISASNARPASLIGRPSAKIAKRLTATSAGGRRGELRAMMVIDIFKENHRFSN